MNERRNVPEIVIVTCELLRRSQTRIDLLFTMSEIPHTHPKGRNVRSDVFADDLFWIVLGGRVGPSSPNRATPGTLRSSVIPWLPHPNPQRQSKLAPTRLSPTT